MLHTTKMTHTTSNKYPLHHLVTNRKSIRAFSEKSVDDDTLVSIFEAARWAPSSFNEQPWRFIITRKSDSSAFEKMLGLLDQSNRIWAQYSAVLIMPVAKTHISKTGTGNRHAFHDVGMAVGNLTLQATAAGLYLHQMGGFSIQGAIEQFDIPAGFEPVSIIAMGYRGDPALLPVHLQEKEKQPANRMPLDQLIYSNTFGEVFDGIQTKQA